VAGSINITFRNGTKISMQLSSSTAGLGVKTSEKPSLKPWLDIPGLP